MAPGTGNETSCGNESCQSKEGCCNQEVESFVFPNIKGRYVEWKDYNKLKQKFALPLLDGDIFDGVIRYGKNSDYVRSVDYAFLEGQCRGLQITTNEAVRRLKVATDELKRRIRLNPTDQIKMVCENILKDIEEA